MSTPRPIRLVREFLLAALALVATCGLVRVEAATPLSTFQESAPPKSEHFESPREAIEAFLSVYEYERTGSTEQLERAARVFEVREGLGGGERARRLAERLGLVFDHVTLVDPARVERELVTLDDRHAQWSVASEVDPSFTVQLGFVRTDAFGWLIDSRTCAQIEGWYVRASDLERIAAVGDKPRTTAEIVRSLVPSKLKHGGWLLEPWQWVGLLLLFLVAFFFERILTLSVRPLVRRLARFEGVNLPADVLARFERPFGWFLLAWLWLGGVQLLDMPVAVYAPLRLGVQLFTTVIGVWTLYAATDVMCWPLKVKADQSENKFDDMLVPLLRRTIKILVVIIGLVFFASQLSGDLWHILAGLSIGSLAIGFAAKDSIENLFGTFTVLLDGPFRIGDVVKIGGDIEGSVEEVGFRSTRIRTPEDSLITVPNSRFISSSVDCLGARRARRVKLDLGVTYDTPAPKIEAFCEGIRELIRAHPYSTNENYHVWMAGFGASSLDIEVVFFINALDYGTFTRERHRMFLDVLRLAQRLGVSFAFPTTTVWMGRPEDALHENVPADGPQGVLTGRHEARSVAAESVGKLPAKPGPVRYDPADPDAVLR